MDKRPVPPGAKDGLGQEIDPNMYARTPFVLGGKRVSAFANAQTGWPCEAPPWGELSAVNLNTGEIAWRVPFGCVDDLEAKGVMNTGSFNKVDQSLRLAVFCLSAPAMISASTLAIRKRVSFFGK
jgi:glucose dehydrogenase